MKRHCRLWRSARWNCASSSCQAAQHQYKRAVCFGSISVWRPGCLAASTTANCTCTPARSPPKCSCCGPTWSKSQGGGALLICTTTTVKAISCASGGRKTVNGIRTTSSVAAISPGLANGFGTTKSGSSTASGWQVVPKPSESLVAGAPESFEFGLHWYVREVKSCSPY